MGGFRFEYWPTEYRKITQHFGANPQNYAQFGLPGHDGIDIRAPTGSKVFCVAPGKVVRIHNKPGGHNYGIHVRVEHQEGYRTVYAHLQKVFVSVGDRVNGGIVLGLADNTGNSFGSHLHITLKKEGASFGKWPYNIIDPTPFLLPLMGWQKPIGPYIGGWILTASVVIHEGLAQVNPGGALLRIGPGQELRVPEGTIVIVEGASKRRFTPVQVAKASIGLDDLDLPAAPLSEPPPIVGTVKGWAWSEFLNVIGNRAIVNTRYGINLRLGPAEGTTNIGVVRTGSTVFLLGKAENGYLPVKVRRADFIGPINLPTSAPDLPESLEDLPEGVFLGWAKTTFLRTKGEHAYTRRQGVQLQNRPAEDGRFIGTIKGDVAVTIAGGNRGAYTPILANKEAFFYRTYGDFDVTLPDPAPNQPQAQSDHEQTPIQRSARGYAFTFSLDMSRAEGVVGQHGLNLREGPHRDAEKIGFVPAGERVLVTGTPVGEFVPVRVDKSLLQPPVAELPHDPDEQVKDPDPGLYGQARIGLHASADPHISEAEHQEFADLRPGIIKVLSFHPPEDIARLARGHPDAHWIVRAFLEFDGRQITPEQFLQFTLSDVRRSLDRLKNRNVVVELHNEPNLAAEGLGLSWQDGASFGKWWQELLALYRQNLPGVRFIYPGLSPGSTVYGTKIDHVQFIEASREAVEQADGLGVHLYWSDVYPMKQTLAVLDDYISRFRNTPIWVTEAGHNKGGATPTQKAHQYLRFWHELQKRPIVQGITFFVASASDPAFANEVWVGRGIGKVVGAR